MSNVFGLCPDDILEGLPLLHPNYPEIRPIYYYHVDDVNNTVEKCMHGDTLNNSQGKENFDDHFGIAKDSPGRRFHKAAKKVATKATTHLIETIFKDVIEKVGNNKHSDAALLLFLGHDISNLDLPESKDLQIKVKDIFDIFVQDFKITVKDSNGNEIETRASAVAGIQSFNVNNFTSPYIITVSKSRYKPTEITCDSQNCSITLLKLSIQGLLLENFSRLPIANATIKVDETSISTTTNEDGNFYIEEQEGLGDTYSLIISAVGYGSIDERVGHSSYEIFTMYYEAIKPAPVLSEIALYPNGLARFKWSFSDDIEEVKLKGYYIDQLIGSDEESTDENFFW